MKNGLVLLAVGLSVVSFAGMMRIKTDVQQMVRQRQKLANEELQLRETKRVLEAEYAMLISPLRLTELAQPRGYEELTMYRLVTLWPHGVSPSNLAGSVSGTEAKGMTLAAAYSAAKAISGTTSATVTASATNMASRTAPVSRTVTVSATRVVPAAVTSGTVEDDVNGGDAR